PAGRRPCRASAHGRAGPSWKNRAGHPVWRRKIAPPAMGKSRHFHCSAAVNSIYWVNIPPQHEAKRRSGPEEHRPRLQERFIMTQPLLMPKATAVWLVDNTALSFEQIAAFCTLHPLEVQGIADGDVAGGIMGVNPIQNGQLTREEIERGETDPNYRLKLSEPKVRVAAAKRKGPRYTPISRRNERPNAIKWLVRNHPELKDAQIMRLVGTTKSTIESVRDSTHWNSANLTPMDPVTLGLCSQ